MTKTILYAALLLTLFGCNGSDQDRAVRDTVRHYNVLLMECYRHQNMNPLQEVTTAEIAGKAYDHMVELREGKLRMEGSLKHLDFASITHPSRQSAVVETDEVWDFIQYDTITGKKNYEEKDFKYRMGYDLRLNSGRWQIVGINTIAGESNNTAIMASPKLRSSQAGEGAKR